MSEAQISYLGLGNFCIHWVFGFKDLLNFLLRTEENRYKIVSLIILQGGNLNIAAAVDTEHQNPK